ncbi:putative bifunctional diguanylate cyclase/phosphodiesterase [Pseudanabaena sp. PCC 6802]|uniref:putative bifunctional diguanylate cyclase/phosphodiesterase n=1 Tax=Pseudanabaena sp. PCC 6802 TaxID=118173 RepID=UPI00034C037B|nr:GGDEF domain-containing response regulator [Pseudanabaena sp. PCC 6802]
MTKILVIEDMESLREEMIEALSYEGFDVIGAENGVVGVRLALEHLPNLIVCDVMMPELDGYETLATLRREPSTATIPFIFLTAKADKADMRQGMELGADDYLTKPFTIEELLSAIAARLKKQATLQERVERELKQTESRMTYLAQHDDLTNLPNRLLFHDLLQQAVAQAATQRQNLVLGFLDIDQFHIINNTLGHDIGDLLLQALARRLQDKLPPPHLVARLRGDVFAIILVNLVNPEEAELKNMAQNILDFVSLPYKIYGHEIFTTASLGLTVYPNDSLEVDGLIKNADTAMYYAKEAGRNSYKFYTSELNAKTAEVMALENSLRRALDRQEFRLFYQPQFSLATGKIVGAEALLRWQHPELGIIAPSKFIHLAENSGLILRLSEWVVHTACAQYAAWEASGVKLNRLAINISGQHYRQGNLIDLLKEMLGKYNFQPQSLELEITERVITKDADVTLPVLSELRHMGLRIAIDDFGTGFSSLSYLRNFPVDTIKIDRCFVRDITTDKHDAAIAMAIIDLAHTLSLTTVAEGVETQGQLDFLKQNQCDRIQGVLFSHAVPAEQLERMLLEDKCFFEGV